MKRDEDVSRVIFMRITVLGMSKSGKTALVSAFVNGVCPQRYIRTDSASVTYRKLDMEDEGEYEDVKKPVLVEIEDTPGSERGLDDQENEDDPRADKDTGSGAPKIVKGSRVILLDKKDEVIKAFEQFQPKGRLTYKPAMEGMLGREFAVKAVAKDGSFGLPSPDGSEGGVWNFPPDAVKLKTSVTLPIDKFITAGCKPPQKFDNRQQRKANSKALQFPLSAYDRSIGAPESDKTYTKNRMGYFLCFDLSDDSGSSLREAMSLHGMLKKTHSKETLPFQPQIWLIGCKQDKASQSKKMIEKSAQEWADLQKVPFKKTCAKTHKGVDAAFTAMIQVISSNESLWNFTSIDDDDDDEDAGNGEGGCSIA